MDPMAPPPPAPAPPQKKSGAMKWVIIGCVSIGGLIVLCCGGATLFGFWGISKAFDEVAKQLQPQIARSEVVKQEIGEDAKVSWGWSFQQEVKGNQQIVRWTWDVQGSKGKGKILVKILQTQGSQTQTWDLTLQNAKGESKPIGRWRLQQGRGLTKVEDEAPTDE